MEESPETNLNTVSQKEENNKSGDNICACSFDRIGKIRKEGGLDLLISGAGWDHTSSTCSYEWANLMFNELVTDDSVTNYRIHLVDLKKNEVRLDHAFLQSKIFRDNLIATYAPSESSSHMRCIFDPNKTGKYPKPEHWIE